MAHKLVGFAHSSNSLHIEYIKNQLSAIANEIEGLATEFANENDSRIERHSKIPDRLPCLMLFKNDSYKTHIHAKLSNERAINWTREKIG
tara:strand:+ start:1414 stop:1683 length:270 start_codon:yes stop_codon:yes gene_type:complete